jgi:hypothetical protein
MESEDLPRRVRELNDELTIHLRDRVFGDPDNQHLLNVTGTLHDRGHVLRFPKMAEGIAPTNNRAERDLRPTAIASKVPRRSKNEHGSRDFEAIANFRYTTRKTNPSGIVATCTKLFGRQPAPNRSTACLAFNKHTGLLA